MKRSFLHSASAKSIIDRIDGVLKTSSTSGCGVDDDPAAILEGGLRCLLVEEDVDPLTSKGFALAGVRPDGSVIEGSSNLALSLAMDAACAAVSSSSIPCRGCCSLKNQGGFNNNVAAFQSGSGIGESTSPCRCCKVCFLIPSVDFRHGSNKTSKSMRKRKRRQSRTNLPFPMNCIHQGKDRQDGIFDNSSGNEKQRKWDTHLLDNIHIQYVQSIEEVIRYLMYAPSLPKHLQPFDGIILFGVGKLCSHGRGEDLRERDLSNVEISHLCKLNLAEF